MRVYTRRNGVVHNSRDRGSALGSQVYNNSLYATVQYTAGYMKTLHTYIL